MLGKLYLIPCTLGDTPPLEVLPLTVKKIIENSNIFIVENEKSARRFIKQITPKKAQDKLQLFQLNKFTDPLELPLYIAPCLKGESIGLLSDAGCPAVADPGAAIVELAHQNNIEVVPLVGPSSILLALMASGMNGQNFAFNGYLPIDKTERKKHIKTLEKRSKEYNQSQICIETPYRNDNLLKDLEQSLHPETQLCVACDITLPTQYIKTLPVKEWKHKTLNLHKRPCIFIIYNSNIF